MAKVLTINEHKATIVFDDEIGMFRGEFVGLRGGADFYATNALELYDEGAISLRLFLEACSECGINPYKDSNTAQNRSTQDARDFDSKPGNA